MVANWKMNPTTYRSARALFDGIKAQASKLTKVETVIAPSFLHIQPLSNAYKGKKIAFAAQDVYVEQEGSYTGEVSPLQLKDVKVRYVIVGHSERRAMGENDSVVAAKVRAVLDNGLVPIVCVGEKERNDQGTYLTFIKKQLIASLKDVKESEVGSVVVAYEPLWAIGRSAEDAMDGHELHQMSLYIHKILIDEYTHKHAQNIRILYGGSVEPQNTEELLKEGNVDGFLVGHASLNAQEFGSILARVQSLK